jgi:hypothetical protein
MTYSNFRTIAVGTLVASLSQVCLAGDWQLRIGPVVENFKYTERVTLAGVKIAPQEDGTLYGLSLRLARKIGQFEIEGALSHLSNDVDYRGFAIDLNNNNAVLPDRKKSDARITDASVRIARWFLATNDRLAVYGGAGYRRWDRDVATTSTLGSNLDYAWPYVMIGAKVSLHKSERASLMLDVRATKPLDPKVDLSFPGTDAATLNVGSKLGYRVEVPFSYKLTKTGAIEVAPFFERIELKESEPEKVPGMFINNQQLLVQEPNSETEVFGFHINWLQEF